MGKRRSSPGPLDLPAAKASAVGDAPSRPAADGPTNGMGELDGVEDDQNDSDDDEVVSEAESSDFDGDEDSALSPHYLLFTLLPLRDPSSTFLSLFGF